jgi:flavodoxin
MNVLVLYASLTGNTRKLAAAMAGELDVSPQRIAEAPEVEEGDLLLLGSGVYWNRPAQAVRRYLENLRSLKGVRVALFGTYGGAPHQIDAMAKIVQRKGGEILGRFSCRGRDWFVLGMVARGHPNAAELSAAAAFAHNMVERARGE